MRFSRKGWTVLAGLVAGVGIGSPAQAQLWRLRTTVSVFDDSGFTCSVCPGDSISVEDVRQYTLPAGPRVVLNTSVPDVLNPSDFTIHSCNGGPPAAQYCLDRSHGSGSARVRPRGMNIHHRLEADAFDRTAGSAQVVTEATGDGTIRWPGMAVGTPIPGTLTIRMRASGTLHSACGGSGGTANASVNVDLTVSPKPRPGGGGLPPAVTPASLFVGTSACNETINGPFVLDLVLGPGLLVGDTYSYFFRFQNGVNASRTGAGVSHADAAFGDTFDVEALPGSSPDIAFDFGVLDDCKDGNVNSGVGPTEDVLTVNASAGDSNHVVTVGVGESITLALAASSSGPSPTSYVTWVWASSPSSPLPLVIGGTTVGCVIAPTPLHQGQTPQPIRCLTGMGVPATACSGVPVVASPPRAPWSVTRSQGFTRPVTFALQSVIRDDGASNSANLSVSNAVILRVQ